MEEPLKQKLKIRNIILITVLNLIRTQSLDLSVFLSIDYPNLKDFRLFILQNTKNKKQKKVYFGIFFQLEREQINKMLIEISKLQLNIEKKNQTRQET